MNSPNVSTLIDSGEQKIYKDLVHLRDELTDLKQDRSTYIRFPDVKAFYVRTVEQAELISDARLIKSRKWNEGKLNLSESDP